MTIRGREKHLKTLKGKRTRIQDAIYRDLYATADAIRVEAALSITEGAVSGAAHVPSRPGEPPNADTGQLDSSIKVQGNRPAMQVTVLADAPYSSFLEFGTSIMEARPFMKPAAKKAGKQLIDKIVISVRRS
jgi:HK97 gp10 family phage protein